jgi:Flp pilus assembly protein protease CpaA
MFSALTFTATACAVGQIIGMLFIPFMASRMLSYKWDYLNKYWWDQCAKLEDFRSSNPNSFPTPKDEGSIGALGIWYKDAITQGKKGELTKEQVFALEKRCEANLRLSADAVSKLRSQSDLKRDYTLEPSLGMRIVCGICMAAALGLTAFSQNGTWAQSVASTCLAAVALSVLGIAALCDFKARILPWELALGVLFAGAAYQLVSYGPQTALYSLVIAGACGLLLTLVTKAFPQVMGLGDVRTIPAIVCLCGINGIVAFVISLAAALVVFVMVGAATRRIKSLHDRIAMGPCLFIAAACGLVLPALI